MHKLFIGFVSGFVTGLCVAKIMPIEFVLVGSVVLMILAVLLFIVFHFGLRDFQEYRVSMVITRELEKRMRRVRFAWMSLLLIILILLTSAFTNHRPLAAIALPEGRTYDQAHDTGYIDWSGPVQYVYLTHKDGSWLPPDEGGGYCGSGCQEWVTRMSSGGKVSGAFASDVADFSVNVAFSHDSDVGSAVLRACSASSTWNLYVGPGNGLPGFVSMGLAVPAGCRSWSVTASGGYVDFQAVDVTYGAPPATSTSTATPLPSMTSPPTATPTHIPTSTFIPTPTLTFTPTSTSTPTNTPTSTPTDTPSPTPTPLPPEITGQVVCDAWGEAGWCKGNESLELAASDPQGYSVTIAGDLNGDPFTCADTCSVPLPEGTGTANYTVTSSSGRTASGSSGWQRDITPPLLSIVVPPADGLNGWHVTPVDVSASASDAISGLDSVQATLDDGAKWVLLPLHLANGIYPIAIRARDLAGNETMVTDVVRVDTVPPVSSFTSPSQGKVVHGNVELTGESQDDTSGPASGELSVDSGSTWQAVSMNGSGDWSFQWETGSLANGTYSLLMLAKDEAGNLGNAASITLLVDNWPPQVSLTDRWWIWESGKLRVSPNYFPIASVRMTISDAGNRWLEVVVNFKPDKVPGSVTWDRRFADGTLAPSGEYRVLVRACDIHDLCGSASGIIAIPFTSTSTATFMPSPTGTLTATPQATSTATPRSTVSAAVSILPTPQAIAVPDQPTPSLPLWQLLGLLGLFLALSSANVVDPRPAALDRLKESIRQGSSQNDEGSLIENE